MKKNWKNTVPKIPWGTIDNTHQMLSGNIEYIMTIKVYLQ